MREGRGLVLGLGFLLALVAAMCYGAAQVVARRVVDLEGVSPWVAASYSLLFGTLFSLPVMGRDLVRERRAGWAFFGWAAGAGVAASAGVALMFLTLERTPVVVAAPLLGTFPLFTLALSLLFIRREERLSWRVGLGIALVVLGVAIVGASQGA